jgi:hypothetical protein
MTASPSRRQAEPATDFISAERKFTKVCVFARPLAELVAPPTMRQHAEMSSTMIADLGLPHYTLAQQFEGMKKALRRGGSAQCQTLPRDRFEI